MHAEYLKLIVANCRQRVADGDCPTVTGCGVETLEEAVVALADALSGSPAAVLAEALRPFAETAAGLADYTPDNAPLYRHSDVVGHLSVGALRYARDLVAQYDAQSWEG